MAQITAGVGSPFLGASGNGGDRNVRAVLGSIDWSLDETAGFRAMGAWLQRSSGRGSFYSFAQRAAAVAFAVDLHWELVPGSVMLTPSAGVGIAPWVKATTAFNCPGDPRCTQTSTGTSKIWVWGMALHVRHFVIEQSAVGMFGGERVGPQHAYFPLMLGVRY